MSDHHEIVQLINLYGLAMDTRRWDLFDRIFTEHVDADYGPTSHWHDRESFKRDFGAFHEVFDATQHVMTNHLVTTDRDTASAHTYGQWRLVRHAAGDPPVWDGSGWYDDTLVRTHGGWRISRRVCRVIWFTGNEKVKETIPGVTFEDERTTLRGEADSGRLSYLRAIS